MTPTERAARLAETEARWVATAENEGTSWECPNCHRHEYKYALNVASGEIIPFTPECGECGTPLGEHGEMDIPFLLADARASDSRSKEMVGLLREIGIYLDELEGNMLRNDADMTMDKCDAPSDWAARLRAAADMAEGNNEQ